MKLQLIPAPLSSDSDERVVFGNGVCVEMWFQTSLYVACMYWLPAVSGYHCSIRPAGTFEGLIEQPTAPVAGSTKP